MIIRQDIKNYILISKPAERINKYRRGAARILGGICVDVLKCIDEFEEMSSKYNKFLLFALDSPFP